MRPLSIAIALMLALSTDAAAQVWDKWTNPKVSVQLRHAPYYGLEVKRVAFGAPEGECGQELTDRIVEDFVGQGAEVIDRRHLESVLAEYKLSTTGFIDEKSAARIGQILGAEALVFVRVQRCKAEHDMRRKEFMTLRGERVIKNFYITRAFLTAAIQTVNLTTGRIRAARNVHQNPLAESEESYPSDEDVLQSAFNAAARDVHQLFFPWVESRDLYFYDDKECGLSVAFQMFRGGDYDGAFEESKANLARCQADPKAKPKYVTRAYHNVGMSAFVLGKYSEAQGFFTEALKRGGGDIVASAMADCRSAEQLQKEMARYEQKMTLPAERQAAGAVAADPGPPETASVEERLRKLDGLLKKGLLSKKEYEAKRAEILKEL